MSEGFAARLAEIRERMAAAARRAGRDPQEVRLLAVSKTFPARAVTEALAAGVTAFGESRIQEALPKMAAVAEAAGDGPRWHLIGHLQRNKAARAVGTFELIHSVDSLALAERLSRLAGEKGLTQAVLLEVNIAREPQKYGLPPERVAETARAVGRLPHLRLQGLMGMAPYSDDPEAARPHFRALKALFDELTTPEAEGVTMEVLSMGMSGDFEVAIEEGATIVRVGSALFGERPRLGEGA